METRSRVRPPAARRSTWCRHWAWSRIFRARATAWGPGAGGGGGLAPWKLTTAGGCTSQAGSNFSDTPGRTPIYQR